MIDRRTLLLTFTAFGLAKTAAAPPPYRVRLIGGERNGTQWTVGIDVTLDDGWKTYWRIPGEAGIPPSFDWSGSRGTNSIDVQWPAPHRLSEVGGETIGYKQRVVFPVQVTAERRDATPELKLTMFFGVCKEVCIPAHFMGKLAAGPAAPEDLSLIQTFAARVPERRSFVTSARVADGMLALTLTADAPANADLFVESDTLAYFRAPRPAGGGYILPIDGLKDPLTLRAKTLRITLVAGDHRLEQDVTVE